MSRVRVSAQEMTEKPIEFPGYGTVLQPTQMQQMQNHKPLVRVVLSHRVGDGLQFSHSD